VQHLVFASTTHYFGGVSASAEFFTTTSTILKGAGKGSPERFMRNLLRPGIAARNARRVRCARHALYSAKTVARRAIRDVHVGAASLLIHACWLVGHARTARFC